MSNEMLSFSKAGMGQAVGSLPEDTGAPYDVLSGVADKMSYPKRSTPALGWPRPQTGPSVGSLLSLFVQNIFGSAFLDQVTTPARHWLATVGVGGGAGG